MTEFQIYDTVAALVPVPEIGVEIGDHGVIIDMHPGGAFEVGFGPDVDGEFSSAGFGANQIEHVATHSNQSQ